MVGLAAEFSDRPFDRVLDRSAEVVLDRSFDASSDVLAGLLAQCSWKLLQIGDGGIECGSLGG